MKKLFLSTLLLAFSAANAEFKVGVVAGPEADLAKTAAKVAKEKFNLEVKVVEFDDYVMPNIALAEKELDANAMQHRPYMDTISKERGFKLVAAGNTFIYPVGAYSKKIKSVDELKEGAKIAFPNDPTNGARALILLHEQNLIKLKDPKNLQSSLLDVVENPKNFELIDADAPSLPRILPDVDLAIINSNYSVNNDLLPERDAIFIEAKDSPYVNIVTVREGDENNEDVQNFVKSYQSEEVEKLAQELFKGAQVKGW